MDVRQGDPLSPFLFCLADDVLSRGITYLINSGLLKSTVSLREYYTLSHVLYVDDIMVFCKGTKCNIRNLMNLFHLIWGNL